MQVLSALILTHCMIFVIPNNSTDNTIARNYKKELDTNHTTLNMMHNCCASDVHYQNNTIGITFEGNPKVNVSLYPRLRNEKRNNDEDESSKNEDDYGDPWDEWSNWSACSVTCGTGRKVRWRHCLSEDCTKGLKRAQIKSCRLKECESKGILNWLGIKTSR